MMMNCKYCLSAGILSLLGVEEAMAVERPGDSDKPNIIFILADDFGWKDLSCMGSEYYETPNIDRLATQGMLFTNAYAACQVSSPSRASIMTGKYTPGMGSPIGLASGVERNGAPWDDTINCCRHPMRCGLPRMNIRWLNA